MLVNQLAYQHLWKERDWNYYETKHQNLTLKGGVRDRKKKKFKPKDSNLKKLTLLYETKKEKHLNKRRKPLNILSYLIIFRSMFIFNYWIINTIRITLVYNIDNQLKKYSLNINNFRMIESWVTHKNLLDRLKAFFFIFLLLLFFSIFLCRAFYFANFLDKIRSRHHNLTHSNIVC